MFTARDGYQQEYHAGCFGWLAVAAVTGWACLIVLCWAAGWLYREFLVREDDGCSTR